jgi:hypothetical protein
MTVVWPGQSPPSRNTGRLPDVIQRLNQRLDRQRGNQTIRHNNIRRRLDHLDHQKRQDRRRIQQIQKDLQDRLDQRRLDLERR